MQYLPEGSRLHTPENQAALRSVASMERAMHAGTILEARAVLCDSGHNLTVQLPCMRGWIPREEGAMGITDGTTKDIALIARAGKPVCFRILRISQDETGAPVAILSRRAVQEECWEQYLSRRRVGDILPATVTHLEKFGAFVDIGLRDPVPAPDRHHFCVPHLPPPRPVCHRAENPCGGTADRTTPHSPDASGTAGNMGGKCCRFLCWSDCRRHHSFGGKLRRVCGTGTQPCRTGGALRRCRCRTVCQRLYQGDPAGENEGETDSDRHICPD